MTLKSVFLKLINPLKRYMFNKQHNTKIYSNKASLSAQYENQVCIEKNTYIASNCHIGKYSYVNQNSSVENAVIGNYCSISSGVYISPYEHRLHQFSTSPILQKKNNYCGVKIGNDVLISLNAIILDGVCIGDGAVIGAGAVVTKNVNPYEIVGGVPAHNIGYRFTEDKIKELLDEKWWLKEPKELQKKAFLLKNAEVASDENSCG